MACSATPRTRTRTRIRTRTHIHTHTNINTHTHTHTHARARNNAQRHTDTKNTRRTGFHSNSWRSIGEWTSQWVSAGSSPCAGFSTARVIRALSSLWPRGPCSAKQVGRGGRLRVSVRMRSRPQGVARHSRIRTPTSAGQKCNKDTVQECGRA